MVAPGACPSRATALLAAAAALALAAAGPAIAATTGDLGTSFENLRLDDTTHEVQGLTLLSGRFRATLTAGRATLLLAGDRPVGLFFAGSGELEYCSSEPIEWPVVRYNLAHNTSLRPIEGAAGLLVRDRFKRLLWLQAGEGAGLPVLTGALAPR